MAFGKRRVIKKNSGNSTANFMLKVDSVEVDDKGNHVAHGETLTGKKMTVFGKAKTIESDGEKHVFGLLSAQNDTLVTKDADGKVKKDLEEMQLDKGGYVQIYRGEWRSRDKVEITEKSHFKVHFYNEDDLSRKSRPSDITYTTKNTVNTFSSGSSVSPDDLSDTFIGGAVAHLDDVRSRAPILAVLPVDKNGQVVADVQLILAQTWNSDEKRVSTESEIKDSFDKALSETQESIKKDVEAVADFVYVIGDSMRFNKIDSKLKSELATTRTFVSQNEEGDKEALTVRFARPGIIKEKFSVVKDPNNPTKVNEYFSVNTIAYTGGSRSPYMTDGNLIIPETLVEQISKANHIELSDSFKDEIKTDITALYEDEQAYYKEHGRQSNAASKAEPDPDPESTNEKASALEAEMDN